MKFKDKIILGGCLVILSPLVCADISYDDRATTLNELNKRIKQQYVEVNKLDEISNALANLKSSSAFSDSQSQEQFASLLTKELQKFDKHFSVQWRNQNKKHTHSAVRESWFAKLSRKNSGFNRVEILDGNVGYVDFWGFDALSKDSKKIVEGVMGFVSSADALILDLRKNGGGSAEMVQLISSYFLKPNTHLNSMYWRTTDSTREFYTLNNIAGPINLTTPIYILTSSDTFSAAEEFAYNLKHLNRATLVGEITKGGANPWQFYELGQGFRAGIPIAKSINPITKTNWEAVGVKPHIEASSDNAFDVAYQSALKKIKNAASNEHQIKEINDKLTELSLDEQPLAD
ncbi:interphotoreceptor retinoid-binding protein [Pseudoalteromonas luteoviolacea]|uniref:Interphotoreceptor retinoid-binding protein n=1 Tax=Pseudoalteromonas luteoviolacea TaxID=43657 RepID=A0A0C1MQP2_9GAMM|nr:S41 family peptidase [Pseudoalteromonas luteoviolacea]KID56958.1 interphotoreceptor retinoid-binding protein [Pseudoalteromonas luteoviolacea]